MTNPSTFSVGKHSVIRRAPLTAIVLLAMTATCSGEVFPVPLKNPSFADGMDEGGVPLGWSRYGGGTNQELKVTEVAEGGKAMLIADGNPAAEIGVMQSVALKGGHTYEVTARVRGVKGESTAGAYLQPRFLPSQHVVQTDLEAESADTFSEVSLRGTAPPDTTHAAIYLYTHRDPTPKLLVTDVKLVGGLPPPPPPAPVPPQYQKLKNLHLGIPLVQAGKPKVSIVVPDGKTYETAAALIQSEIRRRTGAEAPVVPADAPAAGVPLLGNLIVLGNRSTNPTIAALYDRYYCLVDLKYPGREGYVLRSVHNPFGNGHGVVIVGGSDSSGVDAGAQSLAKILANTPGTSSDLSIGWTMETRLGQGLKPPADIKQSETWEASKGYGSIGYFGWTSISKRMAMYYMTGDESSAREVVRLAFPDQQALKDIEEIDGERIENKRDPLAGFYHYNAHMAILFWDLIEESPVFTDAERLKITNAFARQLNHRKGEGVYGLTRPPAQVGSRHGQWSAISLYCLGRYFDKDYPDPIWAQCVRAGQLAFQSLHKLAWISGESDNLFWYNTGIAPILTYMVLTGDRKPLANGVLAELLRGQETLISGRVPDWALQSAALDFLNKAAYLTGDGRWIAYRDRCGMDTDVFRLGQSFWPDDKLKPCLPTDLAGKWSILQLPKPAWAARASGLPLAQSFAFGSFRSTADADGDYILLDGFNGASRNPYHTFDILELRLGGRTILQGYHNQVLTSADGMVEPSVAMDAALVHRDVLGPTAIAVGRVPDAAFCDWRRTLLQRTGKYSLIVDDLAFRSDSQNMKVSTTWQVAGGSWDRNSKAIRLPAGSGSSAHVELRSCDEQDVGGRDTVTMSWNGPVKAGDHRIAFYLIAPTLSNSADGLQCVRLDDNAAAIALPQPAVAVAGEYAQTSGDLVVIARDHLHGRAVTKAGVGGMLLSSDLPLDADWDFDSGEVQLALEKATSVRISLKATDNPRLDGQPAQARREGDLGRIELPEGRHTLTAAWPSAEARRELENSLARLLADEQKRRAQPPVSTGHRVEQMLAELPVAFATRVEEKVADMIAIPPADGARICVAAGSTVHLFTAEGKELRRLQTDGPIRVLRWWNEPKLLLAGCEDEKVIAFDVGGQRKWVFVSEMDPAVYEAAKTYWFKSAPGHEGIHGLWSGTFDGGKSRCFVGSACTLEILDEAGKLAKRTPVFWGPGRKFLLVPGKDGPNLLVSQWPNGGDELAVVSSKTLSVTGRGYDAVPSGHSFVGGWTAQNRTALRHEDLDGDGRKEVATAINGTWNRVTVYSEDGQPLANAQFGPGASNAPRAQMRDMDIADLDGDGKKEILVAISEGLVVALNHRCEGIWSARLPSPPVSLRCVSASAAKHPWVVAGCEDGTIIALDEKGKILRCGRTTGQPTHVEALETPGGAIVVLATDRGEVKGFRLGD